MAAKNSEIRSYLLRYAAKHGLLVKEYISDASDGPAAFYCHLQDGKDPRKTATSVSYEHFDNSLAMCFLSFFNSECNFLDEEQGEQG